MGCCLLGGLRINQRKKKSSVQNMYNEKIRIYVAFKLYRIRKHIKCLHVDELLKHQKKFNDVKILLVCIPRSIHVINSLMNETLESKFEFFLICFWYTLP